MKACIFSDSHGYVSNMIDAIEREQPDLCFFLGDGERDIEKVSDMFPELTFHIVRGNCDMWSNYSSTLVCVVDGVRILATHGHLSNVKFEAGFDSLTLQAREAGAEIALFGHTHRPHLSENYGVTLLNPGSAGMRHCSYYAVLIAENGKYNAELKAIPLT